MEKNTTSGAQYLIMEYCSGGDLQKFIEMSSNKNGLPTGEFCIFLQNFIDGLKHLTENHIVHRDIKPSNILISMYNEQRVYKIANFGAARKLYPCERYTSLYGTSEYLHPDIFVFFYANLSGKHLPKQSFSELHELWSIGATLYEAATGKLPFNPKHGRDVPETLYKMIKEKKYKQIAATETKNGEIQWASELPESCTLDKDIKQNLITLLAGLLQVNLHERKNL